MEDQELHLHIAKEIWRVLRTAPNIVMSWGLNPATVRTVENGLRFHVQGFKHTGDVESSLTKELTCMRFIFMTNLENRQIHRRTFTWISLWTLLTKPWNIPVSIIKRKSMRHIRAYVMFIQLS